MANHGRSGRHTDMNTPNRHDRSARPGGSPQAMTQAQWHLYFALELLDCVATMPSWEAVAWAHRVGRTVAREEEPESAARLCAGMLFC